MALSDLTYQGAWHQIFDTASITEGTFNERMLKWVDGLQAYADGTQDIDVGAVTIDKASAATDSVTDLLNIISQSTGTPAAGIGSGLTFSTETAAGNVEIGGAIRSIATDVDPTNEDFDLVLYTMLSGDTAAEWLRGKSDLSATFAGPLALNLSVLGGALLSMTMDSLTGIAAAPTAEAEVQIVVSASNSTNNYMPWIGSSEGSGFINASLGSYDAGSGGAQGFYIATGNSSAQTIAVQIDASQNITASSLAGTGTRNVVVDANGVMSAP